MTLELVVVLGAFSLLKLGARGDLKLGGYLGRCTVGSSAVCGRCSAYIKINIFAN